MNYKCKKISDYLEVSITIDNTTHALGLLDVDEATQLKQQLDSFVEELDWFIHTQQK
jgi:hypothetical protein